MPLERQPARSFNVDESDGAQIPAHLLHRRPQRAPLQGHRHAGERFERDGDGARAGGQRLRDLWGREELQRLRFVPQQAGQLRQRVPYIRVIPFEGGQEDQPDPISEYRDVTVRLVLAPSGPDRPKICQDLGPPCLDERPDDPHATAGAHRRDPPEAFETAAPQQPHQHRLGLIVQRVTGGHHARADLPRHTDQELVPQPAAGVFQRETLTAGERARIGRPLVEAQPERAAHRSDERGVLGGIRPESMVEVREVNGQGEVAAEGCQRVRERRRVRPAGDRDNNDLPAAQHPVAAQRIADPLDQRQFSVSRSVLAHARVHIVARAAGTSRLNARRRRHHRNGGGGGLRTPDSAGMNRVL